MPKYIVEHVCADGTKRYLIWSTIVDAPLTFGATLEKIFDVWRDQYGQSGVERLKSDLDSHGFDALDDVIAATAPAVTRPVSHASRSSTSTSSAAATHTSLRWDNH